jgi:hypothetical protein
MSDHHFSYPRVVPVKGATISGHALEPSAPVVPLVPRPSVSQGAPTSAAPRSASLAA